MFWKSKSAKELGDELNGYRKSLYRVALAWSGDPMLADDLVQEALARGLSKHEQLKDRAKLENWLFRILSNCWREYLRKQRPTDDIDDIVVESDTGLPELGLQKQQVIDRVRAAIGTLPIGQKQVITLVDLQGLSYTEVSEVLEIPIGTVMSRLSRARGSLKDKLFSLEGDYSPQRCYIRSVK
ncbi:MAG: RNA polymerase sigma factor [bacterium]